jgi:hypothetical protein
MRSPLPPSLDLGGTTTELDPRLSLAFRPLYKMAFGIAVGTATGLLLFAVTAASLLLDPAGRLDLSPLAQFFTGYEVSWRGAVVGLLWGFTVGAIAGWFIAFVRNLVLAVWLLWVRVRTDLAATRDFLDHI